MTDSRTLEYQPALDGVRALAVTTVLLFHHGFTWISGGYVGVSVFFTLSGYLITTLLVTEHRRRDAIALGRFYSRRARRLLPAGLLCLALVIVARLFGEFDGVVHLRRDLLGSLFQVQNWVKLGGSESYTELLNASTGELSPLEHYWSLAIEEQFYWLWPLVLLGLFAVVGTWRARRIAVTALAVGAGIAAPLIAAVWGADVAYWATPARIGEILVGSALAMWLSGDRSALRRGPAGVLTTGGALIVVAAAVTWPADSGPAYQGFLPLLALASAAVIAGLQGPSPLRALLSLRPLVWLGRISYGLYLYHWPVFVMLGERRTGVGGPLLFALRVAVTLAIATLSYVLVEKPIRESRSGPSRPLRVQGLVAVAAAGVVAGLTVIVVPGGARDFYAPDAAEADVVALQPVASLKPLVALDPTTLPTSNTPSQTASSPSLSTNPSTTSFTDELLSTTARPSPTTAAPAPAPGLPVPSRPVRMLVVGDSTALATGTGLIEWAAANPDSAQVSVATSPGCGFIRGSMIDEELPFQEECDRLLDSELPTTLAALRPDVVVLMVTMRDLEDRSWSEAEGKLTPFDARYQERLLEAGREIASRLFAAGASRIVWVLPPRPVSPFLEERRHMADPARYAIQEEAIRTLAAEQPDLVTLVDLASWMEARNMTFDGVRRPDGLHFTPAAALEIAEQFLAPALIAAALS